LLLWKRSACLTGKSAGLADAARRFLASGWLSFRRHALSYELSLGAGGLCGIARTLGALVLEGFSWSVAAGGEPHGVLLGELCGLVERRGEPVK
jgi:hypothetical protein